MPRTPFPRYGFIEPPAGGPPAGDPPPKQRGSDDKVEESGRQGPGGPGAGGDHPPFRPRARLPIMIPLQVHLQRPCYDFYFL